MTENHVTIFVNNRTNTKEFHGLITKFCQKLAENYVTFFYTLILILSIFNSLNNIV